MQDPTAGRRPAEISNRRPTPAPDGPYLEIRQRADDDTELSGMGTTVVGCWFRAGGVAVAHVGDSRIYRRRDGILEQRRR